MTSAKIRLLSIKFMILVKLVSRVTNNSIVQTWGPFLEGPENFAGPKSHS